MQLLGFLLFAVPFQDPSPSPQPQESERTIVITGSPLNPKDVFDSPYSIDLVTGKDVQEHLPRTLPEMLKETPGMSIQKTSNGQGSPFIRGFTGFRNVFLIDGIRLNNAGFRDGPNQYWSTVDAFLVERLEVLKGPASVLYGSDALGGAVSLHSRTVERFPSVFEAGGRTSLRYATSEHSSIGRQEGTFATANGALLAGVTFRSFGDIQGGTHIGSQDNTGYDEYHVDAKTVIPMGPGQTLIVAIQGARVDEAARTHSTSAAVTWHGTAQGTDRRRDFDQERDLFYVQFKWEEAKSLFDTAHLSLSFHRNAEDSNRVTSSGAVEIRDFTVSTPAFFARFAKKTEAGLITTGLEFYRDQVNSDGHNISAAGVVTDFDRGEIPDDSTVDLMGFFVQDEIDLSSQWNLMVGARYTSERIDADDVDPSGLGGPNLESFTKRYSAFVGNLRVLYRATEDVHVIAGISQGFRAPNLDDTAAVRLVMSGQTDFPNPDIDPEYSLTYELGTRMRGSDWDAQLFVFHTALKDFIGRIPAPSISPTAFIKDNLGDGTVQGLELAAGWRPCPAFRIWADYTLSKGLLDQLVGTVESEQPMSKMNPPIFHLGIRWQETKKGPWAELFLTGADKQEHLSPSDTVDTQRIPPGGTPGFFIATLRGGMPVTERATVTLSIENVANKDYRWHGSGTNEPGTNALAGVEVKW